jgi:probable F420-dependent oxidoreductase
MEGMMYPVPFARPEDIIAIGQAAEKGGFHSVWGNDHMTTQRYVRDTYPVPPNFWEILVTLSFVAAETKTLNLGTGMLITPMRRDIVVTAKQIATLDSFSQGRFILGVGVGAYREEFEALAPGSNAHRGAMVAESIEAFRVLFAEREASFEGKYYQFKDVEMYPKPVRNPIPLYVGGNNPKAMERAVAFANGWMPAALTPVEVRARVAVLKELADAAGRDYRTIDVGPQYMVYIGKTREAALEYYRNSQMYHHIVSLRKSTFKDQDVSRPEDRNVIGTAADVVEQIQALEEAGVTHLCGTYFVANTVPELLEQMQIFSEEVMPHVKTLA